MMKSVLGFSHQISIHYKGFPHQKQLFVQGMMGGGGGGGYFSQKPHPLFQHPDFLKTLTS